MVASLGRFVLVHAVMVQAAARSLKFLCAPGPTNGSRGEKC